MKSPVLCFLILWCSVAGLRAQDVHYTQFYNAPFLINPGLTGVFDGTSRLMGNYRSQWTSVNVDYQTFTAAFDHNFLGKGFQPGNFSGGMVFNFDRAGTSRLTMLNLGLNGAYSRRLASNLQATVGAQLGATQRRFDTNGLTFDEQYQDGQVNPNLPPGDPLLQFEDNNNFFDLSAGINIRWQHMPFDALPDSTTKRHRLDVGIGFFHLNRPDQSFIPGDNAPLPIRFSPYVSGTVQLATRFDLLGVLSVQVQQPYNETVAGLGGVVHLSTTPGRLLALQLNVLMRFHELTDAYSPAIHLHYNNWRVGFSYDVNVSEFNVATLRRSGPELSIQYSFGRLPSLFKICSLI